MNNLASNMRIRMANRKIIKFRKKGEIDQSNLLPFPDRGRVRSVSPLVTNVGQPFGSAFFRNLIVWSFDMGPTGTD